VKRQLIVVFVLIIFTAGCATTTQPDTLAQLRIQVAQLERKVSQRDSEVEMLLTRVDELSLQLERMGSVKQPFSFKEIENQEGVKRSSTKKSPLNQNKKTIRVNVSPREIQTALKNAGYYNGVIDGKIGSKSRQAIVEFQKDHELKSDGIIGKRTWDEMKNYLE